MLKFFDEDPDPGSGAFLTMDPGSGMETFGVWDFKDVLLMYMCAFIYCTSTIFLLCYKTIKFLTNANPMFPLSCHPLVWLDGPFEL